LTSPEAQVATPRPTQTAILVTLPADAGPTAAQSMQTPSLCMQNGTLLQEESPSPVLGEPLRYQIYLPPCYDAESPQTYPFLMLLHGQYGDDNQWPELGVSELADDLILSGELPAMLIVFPYEKRFLVDSRESGFGEALVEDLLPYLFARYPIDEDRSTHAIGGISRGANWAFQIGMTHPQLFASIGAHSFTSFGNESLHLADWVEKVEQAGGTRLAFDMGEKDMYKKYWDAFISELQKYDFPFQHQVYPGEHDADYWRSHVKEYLLWYAADWQ
jgi:enterochelin esterase-like enzyme